MSSPSATVAPFVAATSFNEQIEAPVLTTYDGIVVDLTGPGVAPSAATVAAYAPSAPSTNAALVAAYAAHPPVALTVADIHLNLDLYELNLQELFIPEREIYSARRTKQIKDAIVANPSRFMNDYPPTYFLLRTQRYHGTGMTRDMYLAFQYDDDWLHDKATWIAVDAFAVQRSAGYTGPRPKLFVPHERDFYLRRRRNSLHGVRHFLRGPRLLFHSLREALPRTRFV